MISWVICYFLAGLFFSMNVELVGKGKGTEFGPLERIAMISFWPPALVWGIVCLLRD